MEQVVMEIKKELFNLIILKQIQNTGKDIIIIIIMKQKKKKLWKKLKKKNMIIKGINQNL